MGNGQSQMAGQRQDQEEDVPECSGREISRIFLGIGIQECRPLSCTAPQQLTMYVLAYCVSFGIKEEDCSTLFQGLLTANKKNNEFNAAQKRKD